MNDFLQGVTLTRAEALKRGRRVTMLPNLPDAARTPSVTGSWVNGWTIFVDLNNNQTVDATDTVIFKHGDLPNTIAVTAAGTTNTTPFSNANYVAFDGTGYPRTTLGAQLNGGIVLTDQMTSTVNRRTLCLGNLGRPRIIKDVANNATTCTSG